MLQYLRFLYKRKFSWITYVIYLREKMYEVGLHFTYPAMILFINSNLYFNMKFKKKRNAELQKMIFL